MTKSVISAQHIVPVKPQDGIVAEKRGLERAAVEAERLLWRLRLRWKAAAEAERLWLEWKVAAEAERLVEIDSRCGGEKAIVGIESRCRGRKLQLEQISLQCVVLPDFSRVSLQLKQR